VNNIGNFVGVIQITGGYKPPLRNTNADVMKQFVIATKQHAGVANLVIILKITGYLFDTRLFLALCYVFVLCYF